MTRIETLLTILSEECQETAQRVSKALRFTLEEVQHGQNLTNAQRIVYEFNDIVAMMELLQEEGVFESIMDRDMIQKKKLKVSEYLTYSDSLGVIKEGQSAISYPSEIYVTYDRSDHEIMCAFLDRKQCELHASETRCDVETVKFVSKSATPNADNSPESRDFEWVCNECNFPNLNSSATDGEIENEIYACINCGGFEFHKRHLTESRRNLD